MLIPATVEFDLELQGITADLDAVPAAHLVDALVASAGLPDSVHALAVNYTYYRMYATIALPGVQWSDTVRAAVQYAGGQAVRGVASLSESLAVLLVAVRRRMTVDPTAWLTKPS